jgi:hypothetical protein
MSGGIESFVTAHYSDRGRPRRNAVLARAAFHVCQRAKGVVDKRPYGTQLDVYQPNYEWINHSIAPTEIASHDFRIAIGNDGCASRMPRASSTPRR